MSQPAAASTPTHDLVRIFDTTLRDGEQSPGATMSSGEKLEVARALGRLGVDVIETGFPAASPDDLAAVQMIAREVGGAPPAGRAEAPIICGLARATRGDIERAWEGVRDAQRPRIHTFCATSPIHREFKLRLSRPEVLARIRTMVEYARSLCEDVEFSCEDAGRTEADFLAEAVEAAIAAGATTINLPDTVGYTTPDEYGAMIAGVLKHARGADRVILSVHCHDDLGLATANTLAGLRAGARQAEVTINGIGERAGNTALEEVVMGLRTRFDAWGLRTGIDATQLAHVSHLVSTVSGIAVQPNKAIVGANAFAHESGIHQDGMLKNQQTYEIMRPETVGVSKTRLVLGKHSGRHALAARFAELGWPLEGEELERAFERFKALADRKKQVTDADLVSLAQAGRFTPPEVFALEDMQVACGTMGMATATIRLRGPDGAKIVRAAVGTGPVDASFKAIDAAVGAEPTLVDFTVHAVTEGMDALGEVSVRIRGGAEPSRGDQARRFNPQNESQRARVFHGHGADMDIVVASAKAYLAALNRLLTARQSDAAAAAAQADGGNGAGARVEPASAPAGASAPAPLPAHAGGRA